MALTGALWAVPPSLFPLYDIVGLVHVTYVLFNSRPPVVDENPKEATFKC